ncbi:hypothetical protein Naga_100887g5, partial [Nannochloropsis gaditana]
EVGGGGEDTEVQRLPFPVSLFLLLMLPSQVRSINIKENLATDGRSIEEKQAAVRAELQAKTDAAARQEAIAHFRAILLETTQTETEKMQESVSWAKFGENSLKDFKWSLIQEAIAAAEGIDFSEVPSFLLRENPVVWT